MSATLRIGLAGLGTVGCGVVKLLQQESALLQARSGASLILTAVSARDADKQRGIDLSGVAWESDATALATRDDVDVVVELIGGSDGIAKTLVETALANGKAVVSANKALIAHHGAALAARAETHQVGLRFDAAVAGGIPIIDVMQHGVASNRFTRVAGILNGTGNYILTTMQKTGREFEEVLSEAQALGYAEADPSFDVDGIDTAHKLAILTSLAYGTTPDLSSIHIEGIRSITQRDMHYAAELGYTIKLLGLSEITAEGILQRVHPCMVPSSAPIARIDGAFNAVQVEGHAVGRVLLEGQGAGEGPTASSVVADLIQLARGEAMSPLTVPASQLKPLTAAPISSLQSSYYLRLTVRDEPGVLADITAICAKERISVESLIQHEHTPDEPARVVMMTHETQESSMQNALRAMAGLSSVLKPPQMIRMQEI